MKPLSVLIAATFVLSSCTSTPRGNEQTPYINAASEEAIIASKLCQVEIQQTGSSAYRDSDACKKFHNKWSRLTSMIKTYRYSDGAYISQSMKDAIDSATLTMQMAKYYSDN